MDRPDLPLTGLRVLDLSRVLAGPVCCQVLADLGADVVKLEAPGRGDDTRHWGPPFLDAHAELSAYYLSANRGKRSIAVDLAHPASRTLLDALLEKADVLVENFLPAARDKLGLDPARLRAVNPALVVASISGYGRTGPLSNRPGYDLITQATAGLMSITGEADGAPMKVGVAIADVLTGLYAAIGVLSGVISRGRTGRGANYDLALADCTLASLVNVAQSALLTGERPRRWGNAHPQIVPYDVFATADGHLVLGIGNDAQWQRFCTAAECDELAADARWKTNPLRVQHREALVASLRLVLGKLRSAQWEELLAGAQVPCARVLALDEVFAQPQTIVRAMIREVRDSQGRRYRVLGAPVFLDGQPLPSGLAPPRLGEHSREILSQWLAYDVAEIERLIANGAVAEASAS